MNPMKDLEIKQMDSKREMEMMDALDQVRASNARIDKASRDLDPEAILKLVRWDEEETETEAFRHCAFYLPPAMAAGPAPTL